MLRDRRLLLHGRVHIVRCSREVELVPIVAISNLVLILSLHLVVVGAKRSPRSRILWPCAQSLVCNLDSMSCAAY